MAKALSLVAYNDLESQVEALERAGYVYFPIHKLNSFLHTISQSLGVAVKTMVVKRYRELVVAILKDAPQVSTLLDTVMWMGKYTTGDGAYQHKSSDRDTVSGQSL